MPTLLFVVVVFLNKAFWLISTFPLILHVRSKKIFGLLLDTIILVISEDLRPHGHLKHVNLTRSLLIDLTILGMRNV